MKKIKVLTLLLLWAVTPALSQINWVKDLKIAQASALTTDKFIVMDFWATWCGPCKKMDSDMWNTEEMAKYKDKFVFLKIDVDNNKALAMGYQANSIPKVIVIDASGNVLWNQVGYQNAIPYFKILEGLPFDKLPSNDLKAYLNDTNKESAALNIGLWYQSVSANLENQKLAMSFLNMSDQYLKTATKSKNENVAIEADFSLVLNQAYKGNTKKAIKKVAKMDETEMKNFILAYCYKCEGQNELMNKFTEKIKSEELLARLDN
ncbi:thioredoxin family protein [Ekhidna sp.]